jgi:hypothetical protein
MRIFCQSDEIEYDMRVENRKKEQVRQAGFPSQDALA